MGSVCGAAAIRCGRSRAYGALQRAGEHRDYDFTSGAFRSSDVTYRIRPN